MTFDSYLYKTVVPGNPLDDAKLLGDTSMWRARLCAAPAAAAGLGRHPNCMLNMLTGAATPVLAVASLLRANAMKGAIEASPAAL